MDSGDRLVRTRTRSDSCLTLGSTPLFTPPPPPIGRSAGTLLPSLPSSTSPSLFFRQTGDLGEPATHPLVASRLGHYLGPRRSIHPSCRVYMSPLPCLTFFWISLVLGAVPLMAIAVIWWGLLVLSWFPYCGVSLSLVHCRVSFYLFCCGSAEVFRFVVYGKRSVGLVFYTRSRVYFMVFPSPSGAGPRWGFWLGS